MSDTLANELNAFSKQLRKLTPKEQVEAIVRHNQSMALVQSLPPEELLLTINQVGLDDSLELIELLSGDQVKTIFDLDVWTHDVIDVESLKKWLNALNAANPESALSQIHELDIEFLTIMLRDSADIFDLIENDDPHFESDLILYTSDRHYLIAFKTDDGHEVQSHFLKALIVDMMGRDFLSAIRLIESARFETESLLHEDALRLRDGRLQDLGFLPHFESKSILRYVDVDKTKQIDESPSMGEATTSAIHRHYDLPSLSNLPFLREALLGMSHTDLENNWNYIVTVANRVHMAQTGKYSDAAAINKTAKYALDLIEMALSYLSRGHLASSKKVFLSHTPQKLFIVGHSLILRLQRDFIKLRRHPAHILASTSLKRLDSPLLEVINGLLQPEPMFFAGLTDPKRMDYRVFENVRDVAHVSSAVAEVAFRSALLGPKGLGFKENESLLANSQASFGILLATYFVHLIISGEGRFSPLTAKDFQQFFDGLEKYEFGRRVSNSDKNKCLEHIKAIASSQEKASAYAKVVFGFIENELGQLTDTHPDPKFITALIVI